MLGDTRDSSSQSIYEFNILTPWHHVDPATATQNQIAWNLVSFSPNRPRAIVSRQHNSWVSQRRPRGIPFPGQPHIESASTVFLTQAELGPGPEPVPEAAGHQRGPKLDAGRSPSLPSSSMPIRTQKRSSKFTTNRATCSSRPLPSEGSQANTWSWSPAVWSTTTTHKNSKSLSPEKSTRSLISRQQTKERSRAIPTKKNDGSSRLDIAGARSDPSSRGIHLASSHTLALDEAPSRSCSPIDESAGEIVEKSIPESEVVTVQRRRPTFFDIVLN